MAPQTLENLFENSQIQHTNVCLWVCTLLYSALQLLRSSAQAEQKAKFSKAGMRSVCSTPQIFAQNTNENP